MLDMVIRRTERGPEERLFEDVLEKTVERISKPACPFCGGYH